MPQDLTDDKSTLVLAMARCHQTRHCLSQCWLRYVHMALLGYNEFTPLSLKKKWPPFLWHFQEHFLERIFSYFGPHFVKMCWKIGISSFNDLGSNRQQDIIWTNNKPVHLCIYASPGLNTLRPRQNGRHFPNDTFKRIFLNENVRISIKISLKFVPKGPINKIPALV